MVANFKDGSHYGSSPRVRSRPTRRSRPHPAAGIISACAEQTTRMDEAIYWAKDHLRVCGADVENVENVRPG